MTEAEKIERLRAQMETRIEQQRAARGANAKCTRCGKTARANVHYKHMPGAHSFEVKRALGGGHNAKCTHCGKTARADVHHGRHGRTEPHPFNYVAPFPKPEKVVHVLCEGFPLCDKFAGLMPGQWPEGHVWTYLDGVEATCPECVARRGPMLKRKTQR